MIFYEWKKTAAKMSGGERIRPLHTGGDSSNGTQKPSQTCVHPERLLMMPHEHVDRALGERRGKEGVSVSNCSCV